MKHSEINWAGMIGDGKALVGKPYNFGQEVDLKDRDPKDIQAIDCSELIEWLYFPTGLAMPDGSYNQAKVCRMVPGESHEFPDKLLLGDLGFKWYPDTHQIHHVGIYIGNGEILEAKGKQWGVVITPVNSFMASAHFAWWGRHKNIEDA